MANLNKKAEQNEAAAQIIIFFLLLLSFIFLKQICKTFIMFNNFLDTQIFNS